MAAPADHDVEVAVLSSDDGISEYSDEEMEYLDSDEEIGGLSSNAGDIVASGSNAGNDDSEHSNADDNGPGGGRASGNSSGMEDGDATSGDNDTEGEVTTNNSGRKKHISRLIRDIKRLQQQHQVRMVIMSVITEYDIASLRTHPVPRVIFKSC
jgi:hypothetical protein